ncbi:MAG: hypothetical protein J6S72_09010, partial [Lachnospiraceae bacterium]|nr:hypothetical protein [Lachnospiraceae bacterium]
MKKTIRIIAVILVLVLALSGCKKNTDSSVTPDAVTNGAAGGSVTSGKTDTAPAGSTSASDDTGGTASTPAATAA